MLVGTTNPRDMEDEGASIRSYLEALSSSGQFNGTALVVHQGRTLVDAGFGTANLVEGRVNTPETMFQIASVSKQFTAGAMLWLKERDQVSLRDKISIWIPECPRDWEPITIHHLLTHTSGIVHWRDLPELDVTRPMDRGELIRLFQSKPLKFSPGEGWAYSSPAYVLLACIVEAVSGEKYGGFLERTIFRPLELMGTISGSEPRFRGREAQGYDRGVPVPSMDLDNLMVGAGDIWSTTHDLKRWDEALSSPGRLLSASSLASMFQPHARIPESLPGATGHERYGYGWYLEERAGVEIQYHAGDNPGFHSLNVRLPKLGGVIILLANDEQSDTGSIGENLTLKLSAKSS
jgi:CubicO group peptidase (beta-lactamase class C family)